jgi:hypothetical protein
MAHSTWDDLNDDEALDDPNTKAHIVAGDDCIRFTDTYLESIADASIPTIRL